MFCVAKKHARYVASVTQSDRDVFEFGAICTAATARSTRSLSCILPLLLCAEYVFIN